MPLSLPLGAARTGSLGAATVATAPGDRHSFGALQVRTRGPKPPGFRQVAPGGSDCAALGVDARRVVPEPPSPLRTPDPGGQSLPRSAIFAHAFLDERELEIRVRVPRLDRLRGERFGLRVRAVARICGGLAVADVDSRGEDDDLGD